MAGENAIGSAIVSCASGSAIDMPTTQYATKTAPHAAPKDMSRNVSTPFVLSPMILSRVRSGRGGRTARAATYHRDQGGEPRRPRTQGNHRAGRAPLRP